MKATKYKDNIILHKNIYVQFSELENGIQYRYYFLITENLTESKKIFEKNV